MLKFILPAALVGMLAVGGGGLFLLWNHLGLTDKVLTTDAAAGAGDALAELDEATRLNLDEPEKTNGFGMALRMVVEGRTGAVTTTPAIDVRGTIPEAPDGWYAKYYETADGEKIVGQEIIRSMVHQGTTNSILLDFRRAADAGKRGEAQTYIRGQMMMAIRIYVAEQLNENTVQGGLMADIATQLESATAWQNQSEGRPKGLFAKFDGIEVIQKPRWSTGINHSKEPVDYRRFVADLGGYIEIEVITNAADAHVAALFQNIDMAALHAMLPAPLEEYRGGVGWQSALAEPLSTEPPGPSLARRAHDVVNNGLIHSEEDTRILNKIVKGEIEDWNDIAKTFGVRYEPSDMMRELLGPQPVAVDVARRASIMKQQLESELSFQDERLLTFIARMNGRTQAEVIRSREWNGSHHPEVLALVKELPVGDITFEQAMSYPAPKAVIKGQQVEIAETGEAGVERPTVRRGLQTRGASGLNDGCTIEHGVRRCVLGDDG